MKDGSEKELIVTVVSVFINKQQQLLYLSAH